MAGRALDLTYMEYELLRFLAAHPGKVFTRETLLSRVWGYEYYGGARTVDVHVRRLRAKLGEEHAHLIQTVRSVGYRFGQGTWSPAVERPLTRTRRRRRGRLSLRDQPAQRPATLHLDLERPERQRCHGHRRPGRPVVAEGLA